MENIKIIDGKKFILLHLIKTKKEAYNLKKRLKTKWSYIRILPATKSQKRQGIEYQIFGYKLISKASKAGRKKGQKEKLSTYESEFGTVERVPDNYFDIKDLKESKRYEPLTHKPDLRVRKIQGKDRLVWIWIDRSTNETIIRLADPNLTDEAIAKKYFTKRYDELLETNEKNIMKKKIPVVVKESIGEYSKADREYGGSIDFEAKLKEPQRILTKRGEKTSIALHEIRALKRKKDFEIVFHTHPSEDGKTWEQDFPYFPSRNDFITAYFNAPNIIGYIDKTLKSGYRKKIILVKSIHRKYSEIRYKQLKKIYDELSKKIIHREFKTKKDLVKWLRSKVNNLGYDFYHLDPSKFPISMEKDITMEP